MTAPKVVVHDFAGHPFQAELSRELARRGLDVQHTFSTQYVGGKGSLARQDGDTEGLTFVPMRVRLPFQKYAPLARLRFEVQYARQWLRRLRADAPDAVVLCNVPLVTMAMFVVHARLHGLRYVLWHQDIYSFALEDELRRRLPRPLGAVGGAILRRTEAWCARHADHVVAIAESFREVYPAWGVDAARVSVIPNWAPLDEVFPVDRPAATDTDLFDEDTSLRLVYAGTIGRKHNPQLLVSLLDEALRRGVDASLTVVSEGEAADWLAEQAVVRADLPLTVLPFTPADELPFTLGAGDVLVALLEPEASRFSVPSKVLSYMAAGRPILGLMPLDNPSATDIEASGGRVVEPTCDGAGQAISWLSHLAADRSLVRDIGLAARAAAEQRFNVKNVADDFVSILHASPVEDAAHAVSLVLDQAEPMPGAA